MNRQQLLSSKPEDGQQTVATIIAKDSKFLTRKVREFDDLISDTADELQERMSNPTLIDASVVEVLYKKLSDLKAKKDLYENFQNDFYSK